MSHSGSENASPLGGWLFAMLRGREVRKRGGDCGIAVIPNVVGNAGGGCRRSEAVMDGIQGFVKEVLLDQEEVS